MIITMRTFPEPDQGNHFSETKYVFNRIKWLEFVWAAIGNEPDCARSFGSLSHNSMLDKAEAFRLYQNIEGMVMEDDNKLIAAQFVEFLRAAFRKNAAGMKIVP